MKTQSSNQVEIHAPPLVQEQFDAFYPIRKNASTMNARTLEWFRGLLDCRIREQDIRKKTCSVLSVGAGDGEFDLELIRILLSQPELKCLHYIAVEPAENAAKRLVQRMTAEKFNVEFRFETFVQPYEEWDTEEAFDFIFFTHSLHFFPDAATAVQRACGQLTESGKVLVIQQTSVGVSQVAERFMLPTAFCSMNWTSTEAGLREAGLSCIREDVEAEINVTEVVKWTADGIKIASIWFGLDLGKARREEQLRVRNTVKDLSSRTKNGKWILPESLGILVLENQRREHVVCHH